MRKLATYTVTFEREIGDEDGTGTYHDGDEAGAIRQLRDEIQEAFDGGYIAGNFRIEKREETEIVELSNLG